MALNVLFGISAAMTVANLLVPIQMLNVVPKGSQADRVSIGIMHIQY